MNNIIKAALSGQSPFDSIGRVENGWEFWFARELMPMLGYQRWENFVRTIRKAIRSCENVGNSATENFCAILRNTDGRNSEDYRLSRHACYLIAMNGDPHKPEIAAAQSYFAVKTREAETGIPQQPQLNPFEGILGEILRTVQSLDQRLSAIEANSIVHTSHPELPQSIVNIIDRRDKKQQAYASLLEIRDQWCKAKGIKDSALGDYSFCTAAKSGEVAEILPLLDLVKFGSYTGLSRATLCRARKRMKDSEAYRDR